MPFAPRRLRRLLPSRISAARQNSSRKLGGFRLETLEPRSLLAADPYISEFLAVNSDGLVDEDGDASDWIEIHNRGDEPADLTGWSLTDDATTPGKWMFPATTIPADGRLVVFASDKNRVSPGGQLHTNFSLSGDGEYLALVSNIGTIVHQFEPTFPRQRTDVSYGITAVESTTTLIGPQTPASYHVPTAASDAQIGQTWTGSSEPFDDASWNDATGGIGLDIATAAPTLAGQIAYQIPAGTSGNQAVGASLGMDFVVTRPITVHTLGAFDDSSNGMGRTISVQLWSRTTNGTPDNFGDDAGGALLAAAAFSPSSPGTLIGGSRFKPLTTPVVLQPGSYSIIASGYGVGERNGVAATGGAFGSLVQSEAVQFVGSSRFAGGTSTAFPTNVDLGPANRYAAGTFAFDDPAAVLPPAPPPLESHVAYVTTPGVGTHTFAGNLGMDFTVDRPIRITELGVFDSAMDGIKGAVGVSLWSRNVNNTQTKMAAVDFSAGEGRLEPGTSSRFIALDDPIILQPGNYTINASGFVGEDKYSQAQDATPLNGTIDGANGAVRFTGTARFATDPNRFTYEPFHRFPNRVDSGPFNKWAAGTFKYELPFDSLYEIDIGDTMANVNASAYVRIPFNVSDPAAFDALRLRMNYDDGFVAYLNGIEIARRNAPTPLAWNSTATAQRSNLELFAPEVINVSEFVSELVVGENVLAIHALNASAVNTDFALRAELEGISSGSLEARYFTEPTPGTINNQGVAGIVADTDFSIDRGIVEEAQRDANGEIHVAITSATADAVIYYTTDGTVPAADNGTLYSDPIAVGQTTTLRAVALKEGFLPTDVDTQTYLFLDDVVHQTNTPDGYPPHWNGEPVDYGMSPFPADQRIIANNPNATDDEYEQVIVDSLSSLPTLSIVMDPEDLFGPSNGIYSNTYPRGEDWERAASIEYILPDGSEGFQTNAGLQMMGWTSRIPGVSPKHTMRIVFKDEFGPGRLNYQFFPDLNVDSFNTIALRSNSRDAWVGDNGGIQNAGNREARPYASYIRDQWARETEAAMGNPSAAGSYVHLYLNGQYWGLYNTTERPDASFAEDHFGGQEEDYDVLRFCNPSPQLVDGSMTSWNALVSLVDQGMSSPEAYQFIQGNNPDGTRNPDYEVRVDVDSLIDFMLLGYYHGAADWPCNWYAIDDRTDLNEGFRFLQWDNDIAFPFGDLTWSTVTPQAFWNSSPGRLDVALRENPEYRLRFADAVQKHFFDGGALSPEAVAERWNRIGQSIRPGLAAESARWGDYRRDIDPTFGGRTLYTRETYWDQQNQFMLDSYFPYRTGIVLDQLIAAGLFPSINAPTLSQHGGEVNPGFGVGITAPQGTIYYTTDGTDPRSPSSTPDIISTLVPEEAQKRVLVPSVANGGNLLADNWRGGEEPFDDAAWRQGTGGVGLEAGTGYEALIGIDVRGEMLGITGSVFIRIPFEASAGEIGTYTNLALRMRFDDGFVAYLNGVEVARANAPADLPYNALAAALNDDSVAVIPQTFDITEFLSALKPGENILAIHGLNAGINSSDMLISASLDATISEPGEPSPTAQIYNGEFEITESTTVIARAFGGGRWSARTEALFSVGNPLRVTELMYNPPGGDEVTEFIEVMNTGTTPISLPGVRFTRSINDGVEYEFLSTDTITLLQPGQRIVIPNDVAGFAAAYPDLVGVLVTERAFTGNLSNSGEELTLVDADGGLIQRFSFDDAWQPTTDGDGFSLVIIDETADKSSWSEAGAWRASFEEGGSPGTDDVMLADVNGDRVVNFADALVVQAALAAPAATAPRADVNRDGVITAADLAIVSQSFGQSSAPPPRISEPTFPRTNTLPRPVGGVIPVYTAPTPTHGFSNVRDEWTGVLPEEGAPTTDTPVGAPPPAAAAPPIVVRAGGGPVVTPIGGGATNLEGNSGTPLAPPAAQAAAIVDQVHGGNSLVRSARIRSSETEPSRIRAAARRPVEVETTNATRYLDLVASIPESTTFSLSAIRRGRAASQTHATISRIT